MSFSVYSLSKSSKSQNMGSFLLVFSLEFLESLVTFDYFGCLCWLVTLATLAVLAALSLFGNVFTLLL